MLWKSADQMAPPDVNISNFGWIITKGIPNPCTVVSEVTPSKLMKVVACDCSAVNACSRNNCSCKTASVSCTSFCKCASQENCSNPHTKHAEVDSDGENEDSDDECHVHELIFWSILD